MSRRLLNVLDRPVFPSPQEAQDLDDLARVDELEANIREVARRPAPAAGVLELALPSYVSHQEGTSEVGKLTSSALVQEYEHAAKALEEMADRLKASLRTNEEQVLDSVKALEDLRAKTADAVGVVERAADKYREEAKRVFDQVQSSSKLADEVKKLCGDMVDKIG